MRSRALRLELSIRSGRLRGTENTGRGTNRHSCRPASDLVSERRYTHGRSSAYAFEGVEHIAADGLATWGTATSIRSYTGAYATWLLPSPAIIIAAQTDAVDG